jgi:hypothetical protein
MLLALASAVSLGPESLGTRDHILLSQIWDFPFRRLLLLAGSRWKYSTSPPLGYAGFFCSVWSVIFESRKTLKRLSFSLYNPSKRSTQKTQSPYCWEGLLIDPLLSNGRPIDPHVRFHGYIFTECCLYVTVFRNTVYKCVYMYCNGPLPFNGRLVTDVISAVTDRRLSNYTQRLGEALYPRQPLCAVIG